MAPLLLVFQSFVIGHRLELHHIAVEISDVIITVCLKLNILLSKTIFELSAKNVWIYFTITAVLGYYLNKHKIVNNIFSKTLIYDRQTSSNISKENKIVRINFTQMLHAIYHVRRNSELFHFEDLMTKIWGKCILRILILILRGQGLPLAFPLIVEIILYVTHQNVLGRPWPSVFESRQRLWILSWGS